MSQDQLKLETMCRWWSATEPGEALIKGEIEDVRWALAELTKEREANQRLAGIEQALQDFACFESTRASELYEWLESVTGYRSEGNEPNEGQSASKA